jgi:adenosylcobinamide-GDP ribazoletransferase
VTQAFADVRAATAFLTRLPVGVVGDRVGAGAFGVVGAGIGLAAAVPLAVLGGPVPLVAAVVATAVVVIVSGGVHLDGLADTADALAAASPDVAERARGDPRLGSGGVTAIALDLALAVAALATLAARDPVLAAAAVVVAAAVSRSAAPVAALAWTRAGGDAAPRGAGAWFVERVGPASIAAALVTTLVVVAAAAVLAGIAIAVGTAWAVAIAAALALWVVSRRGQLDGDGYGAIIELTYLAVLTGVAIAGSPA